MYFKFPIALQYANEPYRIRLLELRGKITWQWLADHDAEINQVSIYGSRSRLCLEKHYHFIFNMLTRYPF